jgi:UDP-glucuronate decarboxylase
MKKGSSTVSNFTGNVINFPSINNQIINKVLVAGGAGFLGSHLCERLLAAQYEVVCVDNLSTGRFENIKHLLEFPHFAFRRHDIRMPLNLKVDAIFNFACPASPPAYQADPIGTFLTNIVGSRNLLELARRRNAIILQASTSEVYGDPLVSPQHEDYLGNVSTTGPRACYDEGKRGAETLFFDYARQYGVKIKVARIFNTYGPRMRPDDGRVVSNFIVQALQNAPMTVYGSGMQTRSFCYVDDLISGFMSLFSTGDDVTGPINLGNPTELTMIDLAERIIRLTNSKSRIIHRDAAIDDPKQRRPDISRAAELLGWRPYFDIEDGLTATIAYFDRVLRLSASGK